MSKPETPNRVASSAGLDLPPLTQQPKERPGALKCFLLFAHLRAMTKSYRTQFQACNADGTCQHMSRERYLSMPEAERRAYDDDRVYFKIPADYYGPRGPLFCCIKPGRCASKHCPLIKDNSKTIYEANDGSD